MTCSFTDYDIKGVVFSVLTMTSSFVGVFRAEEVSEPTLLGQSTVDVVIVWTENTASHIP